MRNAFGKRLLSIFVALAMIIGAMPAFTQTVLAAYDPCHAVPSPGDASDFTVDETGFITGYSGDGGDVVIPSAIGGKTIVGIEDGLGDIFCTDFCPFTSFVVPSTVLAVGNYAFYDYNFTYSLTDVYFYGAVYTWGEEVFDSDAEITVHCKSANYDQFVSDLAAYPLIEVVGDIDASLADPAYPEVTPDPEDPGDTPQFTIPEGYTANVIAADGTLYLTQDPGSTYTGKWVSDGSGYKTDIKHLYIVNNDAAELTISDKAFQYNTALEDVTVFGKVTFSSGSGSGIFTSCSALKKADLSQSALTALPTNTFNKCTALEEVKLPAAVQKINNSVFAKCTALKNLVIPESITELGNQAFGSSYAGFAGLETIEFEGTTPPAVGSSTFKFTTPVTIIVPEGALSAYQAAFASSLGANVTIQEKGGTVNTVDITVNCGENGSVSPESPVSVQVGLDKELTITPDQGYEIDCLKVDGVVQTVAAPDKAYTLTLTAVSQAVTVDVSFKTFDDFNYQETDGVVYVTGYKGNGGEITLPTTCIIDGAEKQVTAVADGAMSDGKSVNGMVAPQQKITGIIVPENITSIGEKAFTNVTGSSATNALTSVVIKGAPAMGKDAFSGNSKLSAIDLGSITKISEGAFAGAAVTELTVPSSVTEIQGNAFADCASLTEVYFQGEEAPAVSGDPSYPFSGDTAKLYCPKGSYDAYSTAWADMLAVSDCDLVEAGADVSSIGDFEKDGLRYTVKSFNNADRTGEVELAYCAKNSGSKFSPSGKLTIPAQVKGKVNGVDWTFTVIGIGSKAMDFQGYAPSQYSSTNYWFAEVEFPDTLTYIGDWGCAGLAAAKEFDLSKTAITSIGEFAFNNCEAVETIKLPDTLKNLGKEETKTDTSADGGMEGGNVTPGEGIDEGDPSNMTYDDKPAVTRVTTSNIFRGCQNLKEILVNDTNEYYSSKDGVLFTKDGSKLIRYPVGRDAETYEVPEGTAVIGEEAFMQIAGNQANGNLKGVVLPDSLKKVEDAAFRQSSITEADIKSGVEYGTYVFDCCKKLETVNVEDGVTLIPVKAFWGCEGLTSINIPDSVKEIGESAFERVGLKTIDLNKVEKLGNYAFYFSDLEEVTVPATVSDFGTGAFMNCPELKKAVLAEGLTEIGRFMFWYCTGMTDLELPSTLSKVDEYALGYCAALTSLNLTGVTEIGDGAFRNCLALTQAVIPSSVNSMGKYVFCDCSALEEVTFEDGVGFTAVPEGTFYECLNLKRLNLGSTISATEGIAFYCAGWYNGNTFDVYCKQPKEYFTRSDFDCCFLDLGKQQILNDGAEEIVYEWINTETDEQGVKSFTFKTKAASGGCGGGCSGGGPVNEDGTTTYTMYESTKPVFRYGVTEDGTERTLDQMDADEAAQYEASLPSVISVEESWPDSPDEAGKTASYSLKSLKDMSRSDGVKGYHYVSRRGWSVMAATAYVTLNDILENAGVSFSEGDVLKITSSDGTVWTCSYEDLVKDGKFFGSSSSTQRNNKDAVDVPAVLALDWSSTVSTGYDTEQSALDAAVKTSTNTSNLRFAVGSTWEDYKELPAGASADDAADTSCSADRLVQNVNTIAVEHKGAKELVQEEAERVAGASRYETSAVTADNLRTKFNDGELFDVVVLASGKNFPDALAGCALAALKNAPMLLANPGDTAGSVKTVKANLKDGGTVYLLGGEGALPKELEDKLKAEGFNPVRLASDNRYSTNLAVLEQLGSVDTLLVCNGQNFADSLSVSSTGYPILLTDGKALKADQKEWLGKASVNKIYIIGGESAVSSGLEAEVKSLTKIEDAERLAGKDRYETSVKVAEAFFPGDCAQAMLTFGKNFPDGLSGGPLANKLNAPVLLVKDGGADVNPAAAEFCVKHKTTKLIVMGGEGVLSDNVTKINEGLFK